MGPLMFGIYIASVFRLPREGMTRAQWFLIAFSAPVLAIILFQALMSKAYANWAALTYVAGTILAVEIMLNRLPQWWLRVSTSIHAGVFAVLLVAVAFSRPGELPLPEGSDPFARMHGAKEVAAEARAKIAQGDYQAILVDERQMAALMHYYLRDLDLPIKSWQRGRAPDDHFELHEAVSGSKTVASLLHYPQQQSGPGGFQLRLCGAACGVQAGSPGFQEGFVLQPARTRARGAVIP